MGDRIETEYRGHTIRYNDNSDEWSCSDLGFRSSHQSLKKVKERIDKMYLDLRKAAALPCYEISTYGDPSKTEAKITEYIGARFERDYKSNERKLKGYKVAVVAKRRNNDKASRAEADLESLMPDTPEALAVFAEVEAAYEKVKAAKAVYDETVARLPRLTVDDIVELKRIKETEGSAELPE